MAGLLIDGLELAEGWKVIADNLEIRIEGDGITLDGAMRWLKGSAE